MATEVHKKSKTRKNNNLRYAEYYDQQEILDGLYAQSAEGKIFDNLMPLIMSEANILRAYRTIKSNKGSKTPGTDNLTIEDIEKLDVNVPFPVSWTVKMKKKQKETQDILSYHTQAAGCSDKARAKASGGRQPIEECGRTGL